MMFVMAKINVQLDNFLHNTDIFSVSPFSNVVPVPSMHYIAYKLHVIRFYMCCLTVKVYLSTLFYARIWFIFIFIFILLLTNLSHFLALVENGTTFMLCAFCMTCVSILAIRPYIRLLSLPEHQGWLLRAGHVCYCVNVTWPPHFWVAAHYLRI